MAVQRCPTCGAERPSGPPPGGDAHCTGCGTRFTNGGAETVPEAPPLQLLAELLGPTHLTPSHAPTPDATLRAPPPHIPGYELTEELGRGGMGEVWRARQTSLGRTVAVKLLPAKLAQDAEFVARFGKESTALAALNHPHIIQIIDRGAVSGQYFFVMEYVRGQSLRDRMRAGGMKPSEALRLLAEIARAVDHAHGQGIIHRDLKPENILLDIHGRVKVADFGLAGIERQDAGTPELTHTAMAMGTLNYMAPEQRRDAKHVDGRADLYSLGVIAYELLTGELPLGRFKLPSERVPGLDVRLDAVVCRCLEPDPSARFARGEEIATALEALPPPSPTEPPAPAPASPALVQRTSGTERAFAQGRRLVGTVVTVTGAVVLLVVGLVRFGVAKWETDADGTKLRIGSRELDFHSSRGQSPPGALPSNTDAALKITAAVTPMPNGLSRLALAFRPGPETLHAHAGTWLLRDGALLATQAGNQTGGPLIPRAYLDDRVFSSESFSAQTEVTLRGLPADVPLEPGAQRFAELAFRLDGVQVSVFATPGGGMSLAWRYDGGRGEDEAGNSADDVAKGVADEVPVPLDRRIAIRLTMRRKGRGTQVEAALDDQVFARKFLPALVDVPGKVAVGCRNLSCTFEALLADGRVSAAAPPTKVGHGEH